MKKIKLKEQDIENLVKKIIKESDRVKRRDKKRGESRSHISSGEIYNHFIDFFGQDFLMDEMEDIQYELGPDAEKDEVVNQLVDILISTYDGDKYTYEELDEHRRMIENTFMDVVSDFDEF